MNFSQILLNWYNQNKRDLPWRNTDNPYCIWLSEIILQQTRVNQGLPYYYSFINTFPTVFNLANASEQEVLKLWQGLGYYSRARNLHATAQGIVNDFNGVFPENYNELLKLKGVGTYTAAAIASFAYNEKVAVVDGNVFRVLARIFDIELDIAKSTTKKYFKEFAETLIENSSPSLFNQALMEFGAIQCVPKNPDCTSCVYKNSCLAFSKNKTTTLPVNNKVVKINKRVFNYFLIKDAVGGYYMEKRMNKDIWVNLFQPYLIENECSIEQIKNLIKEKGYSKFDFFDYNYSIIHKLSHQIIQLNFFGIELNSVEENFYSKSQVDQLPVPIVVHNFFEKIGL